MIKVVGKADVSAIANLRKSDSSVDDRDFEREEVAVDACVSMAARYLSTSGQNERELPREFADLIRATKRQYVDAAYDERYVCSEERDDGSVLVFQNVLRHRDIGFWLYKRGTDMERHNRLKVATFSIVLAGECTLNLHRRTAIESIRLGPGDVYVFEQAMIHSVTEASGICVHLTTSVPSIVAKSLAQVGKVEVQKIKR